MYKTKLLIGNIIMAAGFCGISDPSTALMLPTNQSCAAIDNTHQRCVSSNPPLPSASGGAWAGPYYLKAGAAPSGYRLESAKFQLVGPHPCWGDDKTAGAGSWARCQLILRSGDEVVWEYDIQGQQGGEDFNVKDGTVPGQPAGFTWSKGADKTISEPAYLILIYTKLHQ